MNEKEKTRVSIVYHVYMFLLGYTIITLALTLYYVPQLGVYVILYVLGIVMGTFPIAMFLSLIIMFFKEKIERSIILSCFLLFFVSMIIVFLFGDGFVWHLYEYGVYHPNFERVFSKHIDGLYRLGFIFSCSIIFYGSALQRKIRVT